MNNNLVFCIECGEMTDLQKVDMGGVHIVGHEKHIPMLDEFGRVVGTDLDFCEFPKGFAYCAPPEQPADWIDHVGEVGDDEILEIDLHSLNLKQELAA